MSSQSEMDLEKAIETCTKTIKTNQSMIVFTSNNLDMLKKQSTANDKLMQDEIKDAEVWIRV